jgi:hypothetical protein
MFVAGKYVLLMDRPARVWVLMMNPLTRVIGSISSTGVKEVWNGLALFVDERHAMLVAPEFRGGTGSQ